MSEADVANKAFTQWFLLASHEEFDETMGFNEMVAMWSPFFAIPLVKCIFLDLVDHFYGDSHA